MKNISTLAKAWFFGERFSETHRYIDAIVTGACCGIILWMTQSMGAVIVMLMMSVWNYWCGGRSMFAIWSKIWSKQLHQGNTCGSALRVSIDDIDSMAPGQSMKYTINVKHGNGSATVREVVVMHADDFEHVLSLASLKSSEVVIREKRDG